MLKRERKEVGVSCSAHHRCVCFPSFGQFIILFSFNRDFDGIARKLSLSGEVLY